MTEYYTTLTYSFDIGITPELRNRNKSRSRHIKLTDPLYARIKAYDGIDTCDISRYYVTVGYTPQVLTVEQVNEIIEAEVAWAATQDGLFPLRGDKTPTATLDPTSVRPVRPERKNVISVDFGTHIIAFQANQDGDPDEAAFRQLTRDFAHELSNTDGILTCKMSMNGVRLSFNTEITNYDTVKSHLWDVILKSRDYGPLFPYVEDLEQLKATFGP